MLSSLVGPKASVKLQPYQSVLYLHPLKEYEHLDSDAPPKDQVFWGNVTLSLPKPREIKSLVVKLVAYYTVAIPNQPSESGVLTEYFCNLNTPHKLDKGDHTFAWSLTIPRNAAPYERCSFGRVYHRLQAVVEGPSGTLKEEIPLEVIVNPAPEGETLGLNERIEGFHDQTGPYLLTLTSGHLTVGGVVHFTMNLASAPSDLRIISVSAQIIQSYILHSHSKPGLSGKPTPHRRPLFLIDYRTPLRRPLTPSRPSSVDGGAENMKGKRKDTVDSVSSPSSGAATPRGRPPGRPSTVVNSKTPVPDGEPLLGYILAGGSLELSHVARMPDDDLLRPTTQPCTDAPIRITHTVVLEVRFSTSFGGTERALRAERPVTISSCCCLLESMLLPSYTDAVGDGDGTRPQGKDSKARDYRFNCTMECTCGFTLERLLTQTHAPILKAHEDTANGNITPSEEVFIANKISQPV
ncbi:hypothetical protein EXIGLDRAFT_763295 [Exidia glandulosa HHB12029]|uniref:Arrestin-like N-terminal domain-containing protein n=1 Tax=Exidia glandulosa HHB12029 TaxID=1314781 RepID=A0A165M0Z4_EXIGL|nr:hypothetical protein EXIGLDRAFT_763295 [Exidia glandulosa HHB12029]